MMERAPNITVSDYWRLLRRYYGVVLVIVFVATSTAALVSVYLPALYRSEAVLMPMSGGKGGLMGAVENQMGSLASMLVPAGGGGTNSQLLALLQSRTLTERVIQRNGLMAIFFKGQSPVPHIEQGVGMLRRNVGIGEDKKKQTILITVLDRSPQLAATIAMSFVEELQKMINENTFTQAKHYRIFMEQQLAKNKEQFLQAGKELNSFYRDGRVSSIESKIDVPIDFADSAGEIAELNRLRELRKALRKPWLSKSGIVHDVPQQVYLQYLTVRRELLGKMNVFLTQQAEMAKMEEAKDALTFRVLDPPIVPYKRFRPQRRVIVLTAFAASLVVSCFGVFAIGVRKRSLALQVGEKETAMRLSAGGQPYR